MKQSIKLRELAKIIRSKNAKPYLFTFDIIFEDKDNYELVVASKVINKELIAKLYRITELDNVKIYECNVANAIKITIPRKIPAGSIGDGDLLGAQQHVPLIDILIPI